jgi:indolepyruvate ferredoxin oxidoreductase, alpha subunit
MAERSFAREVEQLRLGDGELFRGEAILAVTKALLQSGVAYVGGYQGAPISHLMDVFADADPLLRELGIRFEQSASEATAAAMLAASVNYPLRGAVTWKSTVGTSVASDALANVASGGVKGGALIILGEDYGEGSSIMQERSHAFAMKSQIWLLDPRPHLPKIVEMVEHGFALSEASNTPVMLELRIRACHMHGSFVAKDNVRPAFALADAMNAPVRDTDRIVLPPASFLHEQEKVAQRWPAAVCYIAEQKLNEQFGGARADIGLIVQGGLYNTLHRALELAGLEDELPIYVLNVTYPLVDDEVISFCAGKQAVLVVEEGQPEFIEQAVGHILRKADLQTRVLGKEYLPRAGEYTGAVIGTGVEHFLKAELGREPSPPPAPPPLQLVDVPARPSGFCTGCPERPVFTAMKLLQKELGPIHVSCDIGCHLFSILPPFSIGNTTMGYGLGWAGASAFNPVEPAKRTISIMGDGGFWHNGLTSGVGNAVFNRSDQVLVIVDNGYSAATGGQDLLSSRADHPVRRTNNSIEMAVRGVGVDWVRRVTTYDLKAVKQALREAMTTTERGPKVIIAESECMLNRQRRERPVFEAAVKAGKRRVRSRFGVDEDVCTGDHSCIRLSGCPSLGIKPNPDPLRTDPVATVEQSCVGCGVCGEVAHAAVLCPSFYRTDVVHNPGRTDRWAAGARSAVIARLQRWSERRRRARAA